MDIGVQYIETDVVGSKDGVAMIAHDLGLRRIAGIRRRVRDFTARELAGIDIGGEGIITLREALTEFPQTRFNIDIKDRGAVSGVVETITDLNAADQVLVTSFAAKRRRSALAELPAVASSASGSEFLAIVAACRLGLTPPLPRIQAVQIPETEYGMRMVTPDLVSKYHRLGLEVHVWTVNDEASMRRLVEMGVDGIVSDRADIALAVVNS